MAINKTIRVRPVNRLTSQIGDLLSGICSEVDPKIDSVKLGESFDVWYIDAKDIRRVIETDPFPAYRTNYQHHQILIGEQAAAFALSKSADDGSWRVVSAALGELPRKIEKAIKALDETVDDTTAARLLVIPSYDVYTFWLVDHREVYVVSTLDDFKNLRPGQKMKTTDFLNTVYDEIKLQSRNERTVKQRKNR